MPGTQGVVKRNAVRNAAGQRFAPPPPPPGAGGDQTPEATCEARILEHADGVALLEVTCECGRKIQVQCFYAQPNTPVQPKE